MNQDLVDAVLNFDAARITECAEDGYNALRNIFCHFPERWEQGCFVQLHETHRSDVLHLLRQDRELSRSLQRFNFNLVQFLAHSSDLHDPVIQLDTSTLLSELLHRYVIAFSGEDRTSTETALKVALDAIADELVTAYLPQIRRLGQVIFTILQEPKVVSGAKRILILELPIGNSIPTQALRHFLKKHQCTVETLIISLLRNDRQHLGMTRKQLLGDRLTTMTKSGDLIIYLDEWLSGSNFKNVSACIAAFLKQGRGKDISFLPIGMLTNASDSAPQYSSCVRRHKKLVERFGFGCEKSSRFRVEFPPVSGVLPRPGYFFWSEHAWMAGYRKVQLLGMAYSIVDSSVERLMKNPQKWSEATKLFLMQMIKQIAHGDMRKPDFPAEMIEDPESCLRSSYEDYQQVRDQIRAINHPSNLGECDDPIGQEGNSGWKFWKS